MDIQAAWTRLDTPGEDHCRLFSTTDGYRLEGNARFIEAGVAVSIVYTVDYAADWSTRGATVNRNGALRQIRRDDGWSINGVAVPGINALLDVDFGFTPATNLAQVKRLNLAVGQSAELHVAWMDADQAGLVSLWQYYRRTGALSYAYEAPAYQATLVFSPSGFVADYPNLWKMTTR
jgi:uncharacterized protein